MLPDDLPAALERLVTLGHTPDVNIRPVLLRVLVDLFVGKDHHGAEAVRQFEEIASHLLEEADDAARLIVAAKLAAHPQTPKPLLTRLLAERGAVAAAVLSRADIETPALQAAAALGTPEMALAVATRADLDPATVRALAERPEPAVLTALAGNAALALDEHLQRYLVRRGRDNDAVAAQLLARAGDPIAHAALFMAADRAQRTAILAALRRHDLGLPRSAPVESGAAACAQIARVALLPGQDGLDLVLCQALGLPAPLAEQIIDDPGGEPLAVALAALGATPELAARVFILGPPAIGRVYATVKTLIGIVETLSPGAARRLVASITGEVPAVRRRPSDAGHERAGLREERRHPMPLAGSAVRKAG